MHNPFVNISISVLKKYNLSLSYKWAVGYLYVHKWNPYSGSISEESTTIGNSKFHEIG
jgi:hypothetical protein